MKKRFVSIVSLLITSFMVTSQASAAINFDTTSKDIENGTLIMGSYKFPISTRLGDYTTAATSAKPGEKPTIYQYDAGFGSWLDYETAEDPLIPMPNTVTITHSMETPGGVFVEENDSVWGADVNIPLTLYTKGMYDSANAKLTLGIIKYKLDPATDSESIAKLEDLEVKALADNNNIFSVTNGVITVISSGGSAGESAMPVLTNQTMENALYKTGNTADALSVEATGTGTLAYQWYKIGGPSVRATATPVGTKIDGATTDSYTPPTNAQGTTYYYVIVSNTEDGKSLSSIASNVAEIKVSDDAPDIVITSVTVSPKTVTINVDGTTTVSAKVYATPDTDANKKVTWSSSNPTVATVDTNTGVVTGKADGTATITATSTKDSTKTDTCDVKVETINPDAKVTSVTISGNPTAPVTTKDNIQLSAVVEGDEGVDRNVTWTSSSSNVATVNATGLVTIVANGTTDITATSVANGADGNPVTATVSITVALPGETIDITALKTAVSAARTVYENTTVSADGTDVPTNKFYVTEDNRDMLSGLKTLYELGEELIQKASDGTASQEAIDTATGDITASTNIVKELRLSGTQKAVDLTVDSSTATVKVGDTKDVTAISNTPNATITAVSDKTEIATATFANGKVTILGVKVGDATITVTASANGLTSTSKEIKVTVTGETPSEKTATPSVTSAVYNNDGTVTVIGTTVDGATITLKKGDNEVGTKADVSGTDWTITIAVAKKVVVDDKLTATAKVSGKDVSDSAEVTVTGQTTSEKTATPTVTSAVYGFDGTTVVGTSEIGATVKIKANSSEVGTATADGEGDWTVTITEKSVKADTELTITATAAGKTESDAVTTAVATATETPVISSAAITEGKVTVSGIAVATATVKVYKVDGESLTEVGTVTLNDTNWTLTIESGVVKDNELVAIAQTTGSSISKATEKFTVTE